MRQPSRSKQFLAGTRTMISKPLAGPVNHSLADEKILHLAPLNAQHLKTFRSTVRSLIYNAVSIRPDFCVAESMLGPFAENPTKLMMMASERSSKIATEQCRDVVDIVEISKW